MTLMTGLSGDLLFLIAYISITLLLFGIDLHTYRLPNSLTYLLGFIGIITAISNQSIRDHGYAAMWGGGILLLIYGISWAIYNKEAMGWGDIKLMTGIGACWGLQHVYTTLYLSSLIGGIVALVILTVTDKKRTDMIPFGPIIITSSWITLLLKCMITG